MSKTVEESMRIKKIKDHYPDLNICSMATAFDVFEGLTPVEKVIDL